MTLPRQLGRHRAPSDPQGGSPHPERELEVLVEQLHGRDHHARAATLRELGVLADGCPQLRPAVAAAVCAWLRTPWDLPASSGEPAGSIGGSEAREPESRRAGVALIADRLRDPHHPASWTGLDVDLAGAVLTGADFSGCWFTGGQVRLEGAWCIEGRLSFAGAHVTGGHLSLRHWTSGQGEVDFSGARFSGGVVSLAGAVLDAGVVSFAGAVIDGGVVALTEARVGGGTVDLSGVTVTDGLLSLADARVAAGRVLLVDARLLGGVTALRDAVLAPGVLATAGAQTAPGALVR